MERRKLNESLRAKKERKKKERCQLDADMNSLFI
jgi:hypothetical protein